MFLLEEPLLSKKYATLPQCSNDKPYRTLKINDTWVCFPRTCSNSTAFKYSISKFNFQMLIK